MINPSLENAQKGMEVERPGTGSRSPSPRRENQISLEASDALEEQGPGTPLPCPLMVGWCCWFSPTGPSHPVGRQNPNVRLCCDPVLQHQVGFQDPCPCMLSSMPLCLGSLSPPYAPEQLGALGGLSRVCSESIWSRVPVHSPLWSPQPLPCAAGGTWHTGDRSPGVPPCPILVCSPFIRGAEWGGAGHGAGTAAPPLHLLLVRGPWGREEPGAGTHGWGPAEEGPGGGAQGAASRGGGALPGCARRRGRVAGRGQLQPVLPGLRCAALPPLEPAAASPSPPASVAATPGSSPGP